MLSMRGLVLGGLLLGAAGLAGVAGAQAPVGAPAGANGICKDGTYSMATTKDGACRGHKGVQTWYVAAGTAVPAPAAKGAPAMPAPSAAVAPSAASRPAPAPAQAPAAMPAPTPAQSVPSAPAPTGGSAASTKGMSPEARAAQKTAAPGGGPGLVWVNTASNVYHCNGDPFYGKTKAGKYMPEDQAKAAGAHGERGKTCAGK